MVPVVRAARTWTRRQTGGLLGGSPERRGADGSQSCSRRRICPIGPAAISGLLLLGASRCACPRAAHRGCERRCPPPAQLADEVLAVARLGEAD